MENLPSPTTVPAEDPTSKWSPTTSIDHGNAGKETPAAAGSRKNSDVEKTAAFGEVRYMTFRTLIIGLIVSMGGFVFGYDTGSISGFIAMRNFKDRFGDVMKDGEKGFSNIRSGTIVGLLSIGTLIGALTAAPFADRLGRKLSVIVFCVIYCVGVVVEISTGYTWYQVAIGRWVAGLGIGGLSVLTPMYQAEAAPKQVRGALVSAYQLFITLGIFLAYLINFGTESIKSASSWRITMGIGFAWPVLMSIGMLFLRESPRWDYSKDNIDRARATIAKTYCVPIDHPEVNREIEEIKQKHEAENAGGSDRKWYEIFTAPAMGKRVIIGITMQMLQQLTGANFFFYYGTTVFTSTGLSNSYVTSIILGAVNFGTTFLGLWTVEKAGRRICLIVGALEMFVCFIIFASLGHFALDRENPQNTPHVGSAMIVFTCLFIAGFASTWGPIVWAVCAEIYPTRYRAKCMGIATASNWIWNFLISFFTPFITGAIDYRYGYVFAACCFAGAVFVFFFVCESQGKTLEEIDSMYIFGVKPWKSAQWHPAPGEPLPTLDDTHLAPGARDIRKEGTTGERRDTTLASAKVKEGMTTARENAE